MAALVLSLSLALATGQAALASPETDDRAPVSSVQAAPTAEQMEAVLGDLKSSKLDREVSRTATEIHTTYALPEGFGMTVVEQRKDRGGLQPLIGGGSDSQGSYVLFNQFDQDMLYSGSGALLAAAICAIPGIGWLACLGIGMLITAATTAIANNGKCTNNRQLKMYINTAFSSCV